MSTYLRYDSPLDSAYAKSGPLRWPTFKAALSLAAAAAAQQSVELQIVETGCTREPDDWGGGMSTVIFGNYCRRYGGRLTTIDNEPKHLAICRERTAWFGDRITYVEDDSRSALMHIKDCHLLYLDSFDYPYGDLLDCYGGKDDIESAKGILRALPESEVVRRHGEIIRPSQEHCLAELQALTHYPPVILIDDNDLPGGGKPRLAKPWLEAHGYMCVLDLYQTLWISASPKSSYDGELEQ